ncbi:MAG: carbohydrate binding family 9 domain-containing protein, partial [Gemmatimonadales bacterium]
MPGSPPHSTTRTIRLTGAALCLLTLALARPRAALAQGGGGAQGLRPTPIGVASSTVAATRATTPPVIDGRDDYAVWASAPAITGFQVFRPTEGGTPKFRTEAKVAYDSRYLYVFIHAFDPHPDSIVGLLARRDASTPSDLLTVFIDGYHDRRTGYEFDVNPAGVKDDQAIYQDGKEDIAWDGIWDVATRIDSLGWTAEFRIPFSQIRHAAQPSDTFGFTIARMVERTTEQSSWPLYHVSRPGLASQLGTLIALNDLAPPERLEMAPYLVTKNVDVPTATGHDRA